jgi:hypothetical protein
MQVIAAGSLPKAKAANWVDGGDGMMEGVNPRWTVDGMMEGFVRKRAVLACSLVGVTGRDYCTYYCLSKAWDRRWRGRVAMGGDVRGLVGVVGCHLQVRYIELV